MKDFFAKLCQNKKQMWALVAGAVAVVAAIAVAALLLLGDGNADTKPTGDITYTISVKTEGGMVLPELQVLVYTDDTLMDLVAVGKTDINGQMQFTAEVSDSYVATVSEAPRGYAVADAYTVDENTEIVLKAELLKDADLSTLTFAAGDVMFDFTVTDTKGNTYTLSELLTQKKAVVLNFWFVGCDPCKAEFPHLQKVYEASNDVAVLAISPVSNEEAISQFAAAQGLNLPMVSVTMDWEKAFGVKSYPTTVVIDRYGVIGLTHIGAVNTTKTFQDLFDYFTAEDYTQKKLTSIEDIYAADGSQERPYEFGGVNELEVAVAPGQLVYCDVYKVSGMEMTINDSEVYVVYGGETYEPKDGVVRFVVNAPDTFTPIKLAIGNKGAAEKTVKVTFAELPGTSGNPYTMEMGSFTVEIAEGNTQGVYYRYTAAESGTVSVQCTAAEGVKYTITLYNQTTGTFCTLDSDSAENILSAAMNAGDVLQFSASTLPDKAASLPITATFTVGEVEKPTETPTEAPTEAPTTNSGGSQSGGDTGSSDAGEDVGTYTELYVTSDPVLVIGVGETSVTLNEGKVTYFVFNPTKSGTYSFTASETISYWGNNTSYISNITDSTDISGNKFTLNINDGHLGSSFVIGVKAGRKVTSGTLTIKRTGNAVLGIEDEPWVTYKGSYTPTKNFPASGANMTIVDITAPTSDYTLVKGDDGFYHLGSATGPLVYLDFNDTTRMGALADILENGIGVRAYVKKSGKTVKEEYTELFAKYVECMDSNGCYPLTDDLIYILKNFGAHQKWWDVSTNGILTGIVGMNKEIAWMAACYY